MSSAGGAVVRDLFDAEAVYVENPALMAELAEEKLAGERDSWVAQGWGWVETSLGQGRADGGYAAMRLQPDWREYTDAEEAELTRLRHELDALDAALDEDSIEEDPRWEERDTLAASIETLRQSARVWNKDLIAHAGVVIAIAHDGEAYATLGVVRQPDEKTIKDIRKRLERAETGDDVVADDEVVASPEPENCLRTPKVCDPRFVDGTYARDSSPAGAGSGDRSGRHRCRDDHANRVPKRIVRRQCVGERRACRRPGSVR
jgi:ParB family chromosome partitioning protein